jgi:hypothetical protein
MPSLATKNIPPSPVLPLPPTHYDPQYMLDLVRLLNYYIQQTDNPGLLRTSRLEVAGDTVESKVSIDPSPSSGTQVIITGLPTSSAGLATGQVYNNAGTLKIV